MALRYVRNQGELDFRVDTAPPEELWPTLSETVRARINARAGTILDWWAAMTADRRPAATVLGTNALISVVPTTNERGGRANRIVTVPLDANTFTRARIQAPSGWQEAPARVSGRRTETGSTFTDLLAYLPPQARELAHEPFLASAPHTLRHDHYYLRMNTPGPQDLGATLRIWFYLADDRSVTFTVGIGQGFRAGIGADSWDLTCWRAAVQPPTR